MKKKSFIFLLIIILLVGIIFFRFIPIGKKQVKSSKYITVKEAWQIIKPVADNDLSGKMVY